MNILLDNTPKKPSVSSPSPFSTKAECEAFDTSDELIDNLVKNAALTTTKDVIKQRKLARYAQRQSRQSFERNSNSNFVFLLVRRTLQINLNDEERAEVFGTEKN